MDVLAVAKIVYDVLRFGWEVYKDCSAQKGKIIQNDLEESCHQEILKRLDNLEHMIKLRDELRIAGKSQEALQVSQYVEAKISQQDNPILESYLRSEAFWEDFKKEYWSKRDES